MIRSENPHDPKYPEYSLQTHRVDDLYYAVNQCHAALTQTTSAGAAVAVQLASYTPNLDHYVRTSSAAVHYGASNTHTHTHTHMYEPVSIFAYFYSCSLLRDSACFCLCACVRDCGAGGA